MTTLTKHRDKRLVLMIHETPQDASIPVNGTLSLHEDSHLCGSLAHMLALEGSENHSRSISATKICSLSTADFINRTQADELRPFVLQIRKRRRYLPREVAFKR